MCPQHHSAKLSDRKIKQILEKHDYKRDEIHINPSPSRSRKNRSPLRSDPPEVFSRSPRRHYQYPENETGRISNAPSSQE